MFAAVALSPVFAFDHSAQLPVSDQFPDLFLLYPAPFSLWRRV
jgi:hypothetical protein